MGQTDIVDQSNNNKSLTPLNGLIGYAHKMSEGHTFFDTFAAGRLQAAKNAGLRYICAYHVIRRNSTDGADQARFFLDLCKRAGFDISAKGSLVMNDWEGWSDGFATPQQSADFNDTVNNAAGREVVIVYGGLPNPYDMGDHIWLADYRSVAQAMTNRLWHRAAVWQWTNVAVGGGDTSQILDSAWLDHLAGYDKFDPQGDEMTPTDWVILDAKLANLRAQVQQDTFNTVLAHIVRSLGVNDVPGTGEYAQRVETYVSHVLDQYGLKRP